MAPINLFAVLVAALVMEALGFFWYGPWFGGTWAYLMGFTPEKMAAMQKKGGMGGKYVANFIAGLVMAYVLAMSIAVRPLLTGGGAIFLAFWIWLGFIATVMLTSVLWEGKPWRLFWLSSLYYLLSLIVMAEIILALR